ncbi:hypothetical protein ACSQ67_012334 [Phaseolus vulgaris]
MGFRADEAKPSMQHQPCAACRMLRRRCDSKCVLAPYFPTNEVENFAVVHRVFGASNVVRMIQMVEETKREDAVKSMVYEATARLRDPVYGSAGAIYELQKMIEEVKAQLDSIKTRVSEMQEQKEQLLSISGNYNPLFGVNDPMFDSPMASDPFEFPLEGGWVYTNIPAPSC